MFDIRHVGFAHRVFDDAADGNAGRELGDLRHSSHAGAFEVGVGGLELGRDYAEKAARKSGLDAESRLQSATDKFVSRFNRVEDELRARGKKLGEAGLEELDEIWNALKRGRKVE